MATFYYVSPENRVEVCPSPRRTCPHEHTLFLSTAARAIAETFGRSYHIDREGEIARCDDEALCPHGPHFLTRREVVRHHKHTYDFSGPWRPLANPYSSLLEREFGDFMERMGSPMVRNTRGVIGPYEVDLYFPQEQVAFEFNGDFWHSEEAIQRRYGISSKAYHHKKKVLCEEQGVRLGFVWEANWRQDWVAVVDAACEMLQFRRFTPLLTQLEGPLSPMQVHFEAVDRGGMERPREILTKKALRKLEREEKARKKGRSL